MQIFLVKFYAIGELESPKKHTKGSREAAFGCFIRDERDYLATIAYVTVGCKRLVTYYRIPCSSTR